MKKRGNKEEVFHGLAMKTSGGLTKANLILNKRGKVVSRSRSMASRKSNNLGLHGTGLGDDIYHGVMDYGKNQVKKLAKNSLDYLADEGKKGIDTLNQYGHAQIGDGFLSSALGAIGLGIKKPKRTRKPRAIKGGDMAYTSAGGKVHKKRGRKPKVQYGEGFFDDFASGFSKGFNGALDVGTKLLPFIL
jgi:DVNP family